MTNHREPDPCEPFPEAARAARLAVDAAAAVCRLVQVRIGAGSAIAKDDASPVTIADFAAQAIVARELRRGLGQPELRLVAEESAAFLLRPEHAAHRPAVVEAARFAWPDVTEDRLLDAIGAGSPDGEGSASDGYWSLDPIDGTKGFLRGQQYCIALAYIRDGAPVIGAVACPNLSDDPTGGFEPNGPGVVYTAAAGCGVWETVCGRPDGPSRRVRHPGVGRGDEVRVCRSAEVRERENGAVDRVIAQMGMARDWARLDSQCKYAVVARGQADVYLRLPRGPGHAERVWDHAPGVLLAVEAGCVATDVNGLALEFGAPPAMRAGGGVVAAPPGIHGKVLEAISAARAEGSRG